MPVTDFPRGISSFGVPILGGAGVLSGGTHYFVDPVNGLNSNDGLEWGSARKQVNSAHSLCTAGAHDTVYLFGNGATSGTARQDSALLWSKNSTNLIGLDAPTMVAQRSRVATTSGTNFTPLVTWSANGAICANVHFFHGYATAEAQICFNVTGQRNYFYNCHFAGMGNATAGDQAGSSSLSLTGDGENTFERCTIGLDTVARSTTNGEIDFKTQAVRNVFRNCIILSYADNAGHVFLKADSSLDTDRWQLFDNCIFINAVDAGATAMTAGIKLHASAGGSIILKNCTFVGATDIDADDTAQVVIDGAAPTANTSGIGINTTA